MTVKEKLTKKASREAAVELDSTLALNEVYCGAEFPRSELKKSYLAETKLSSFGLWLLEVMSQVLTQ